MEERRKKGREAGRTERGRGDKPSIPFISSLPWLKWNIS